MAGIVDVWMGALKTQIHQADVLSVRSLHQNAISCFGNCTVHLVVNKQAEESVECALAAVNDYCEQIETPRLYPNAVLELDRITAETLEMVQSAHDVLSNCNPISAPEIWVSSDARSRRTECK